MGALDSHRRYAASAGHYHLNRPSYPAALVDWITAVTGLVPPARVADIGCGTGIASRLFSERGFTVVGVDPSQEMLTFAHDAGRAQYVRGEAAATGLASRSMDLVIAAQSFHWFDAAAALREFRRVLRPHGWCAAFWNLRGPTPLVDEYYALIQAHSSQYDILLKQEECASSLRVTRGVTRPRQAEFVNSQLLDRDGLLGRAYSSSCVKHGVRDPAAFEAALGDLFDRYQRQGRVEFRYRTVALCWRLTERRSVGLGRPASPPGPVGVRMA
jgi:SAM-dependent methyltransferase